MEFIDTVHVCSSQICMESHEKLKQGALAKYEDGPHHSDLRTTKHKSRLKNTEGAREGKKMMKSDSNIKQ